MCTLLPVQGKTPHIHPSVWLAPDAVITGDVTIEAECSIWFKSVIRGDVCSIRIGHKTNIQDGVIIHGTYQNSNTDIGESVSVGHGAILHGCTIQDRVLIGMRSVVMDHAIIESETILAAGAVVLENSHLESGYIYGGIPARKIKKINDELLQFHIDRTAEAYVKYASWYRS